MSVVRDTLIALEARIEASDGTRRSPKGWADFQLQALYDLTQICIGQQVEIENLKRANAARRQWEMNA